MKKVISTSFVILILLSLTFTLVGAQDPVTVQSLPGGGWVTGTQVQNVGTGPAQIHMTVYGESSGEWTLTRDNVPVGGSENFLATSFGWSDGSIGSAMVSADQRIVAQTTETNGTAAAQYQGIAEPATQVNFPLVKNDYKGSDKYTTFYVQNAGSSAAMIYAKYTDESGTEYTWDSGGAVDQGRMVVLNPSDVGFPSDELGSLVVTSTVHIAGVVNEHGISSAEILQATRGFTPNDAGTTLLIPTIKQNFGNRSTGAIIQNAGNSSADITISYSGTSFKQYANNVAPGASVTFFNNSEICPDGATCGNTGTPLPDDTLTSAVVTASGSEIVGVVNETFMTVPSGQRQRQTVTSAFNQAAATNEIGVPLYKVHHDYKASGLQIQNTNLTSSATYTATFALGSGASYKEYVLSGSINGGEAVTLYKLFASLPSGASWVGDAIPSSWSSSSTSAERFGSVTVVANQPIVGVVTEADEDPSLSSRQDIKSYEAFVLSP